MNTTTFCDTGPPSCRATRPPGKGAGIGADKQLRLTSAESNDFLLSSQTDPNPPLPAVGPRQDPRKAQLQALAHEEGDTAECARADLFKEFGIEPPPQP